MKSFLRVFQVLYFICFLVIGFGIGCSINVQFDFLEFLICYYRVKCICYFIFVGRIEMEIEVFINLFYKIYEYIQKMFLCKIVS